MWSLADGYRGRGGESGSSYPLQGLRTYPKEQSKEKMWLRGGISITVMAKKGAGCDKGIFLVLATEVTCYPTFQQGDLRREGGEVCGVFAFTSVIITV